MSHRFHQLAAKRGEVTIMAQARSKQPELTPAQIKAALAAAIAPTCAALDSVIAARAVAATTRITAPLETRLQQQRYVSGPESPPVTESEFAARVNVYSGAIALGVPNAPSAQTMFAALKGDIRIEHEGREVGKLIALELSASADEGGVISGEVQLSAAGKAAVRAALPGVTQLVPILSGSTIDRVELDAPPTTPASALRAQASAHSRMSPRQHDMISKLGWGPK